jgi:hypothetical protein
MATTTSCHKLVNFVLVAVEYAVGVAQPSAPARPLAITHPSLDEARHSNNSRHPRRLLPRAPHHAAKRRPRPADKGPVFLFSNILTRK